MSRLLLQQVTVSLGGHADVSCRCSFVCSSKNLGALIDACRCTAQRLLEGFDLTFGYGAHETVYGLTVPEGVDGRNRLNSQLAGDLLILVDVDFDEAHGTLGLVHRLLQGGPQLLTGAAPGRPEIDDDRNLARGFEHVSGEGRQRTVLYIGTDAVGRRRFGRRSEWPSACSNQCHRAVSMRSRA